MNNTTSKSLMDNTGLMRLNSVFEERSTDAFTAEEQKLLDTVGVHEAVGQTTQLTRKSVPSHFLNHMPTEVTLRHYQLWREYIGSKKPVVDIQYDPVFGSYELTVICSERRGILADLTEALKSEGFDVISAKIFSLPNHSVMDIFRFDDHDEKRASKVYQRLLVVVSPEREITKNETMSSKYALASNSSANNRKKEVNINNRIPGLVIESPTGVDSSKLAEKFHQQAGDLLAFEGLEKTVASKNEENLENSKKPYPAHTESEGVENSQQDDTLLYIPRRHSIEIMENVGSWGGSAPKTPSSTSSSKQTKSLLKSFSNLAMVDLEDMEKEKSLEGLGSDRKALSDMKLMQLGEVMFFSTSQNSKITMPMKTIFRVSKDFRYLKWNGNYESLSFLEVVELEYGIHPVLLKNCSKWFDEFPSWLWFFIKTNSMYLFIAAVSEEQLDHWLLGIQSLLPDIRKERKILTRHSILVRRFKMKCLRKARRRGLTLRQHILMTVRTVGNIIHQYGRTIHDKQREAEPTNSPPEGVAASYSEDETRTIDLLRRQLEAANEQIEHLSRELELSSSRVAILKNKLKLVQRSWEKIEKIGNGAYSDLFKAEWRGTIVAMKLMKAQETSEEVLRQFHDEVNTLSKLRHPNIVLFMGACGRPPNVSIITEFCFGGNVYNALRKPSWKKLTHVDLVYLARDIVRGILYLHSNKIIHRDVKSQNLLLDKPIEAGRPSIKLADFGLSRTLIGGSNSTGIMTSETGTYRWMAPEVIRHEQYSEKVDVYSFGVTLWEFFSCEVPFSRLTPIQAAFAVADKNLRPDLIITRSGRQFQIPLAWRHLIERCWDAEPYNRPNVADIIPLLNEMEQLDPNQLPTYWKTMEEPH
eukprot:jgi/Galph1/4033/GphlegSOOS_G2693.1